MTPNANTLACVSCGYEMSHPEQSTREFCPRCRTTRAFTLKEGGITSFAGMDDFEVIHVYSREHAIRDGELVDATAEARHLGFRSLVTLTSGVWTHYVEGAGSDEQRALQAFLHRIKGSVHVLLRVLSKDPERSPVIDAEVRDRTVRIILTQDEGGRPDVRIMFPEEE